MRSISLTFSFYTTLIIAGILILFAAALIGYEYNATSRLAIEGVDDTYRNVTQLTVEDLEQIYQNATLSVSLLARQEVSRAETLGGRLENLPFFVASLKHTSSMVSQYIGYDNGDFFLVRRNDPAIAERLHPPPNTHWIVQSITHKDGVLTGEYLFYGDELQLLERRNAPDYTFDPRLRPWYQARETPGQMLVTKPYLFATSGLLGTTFAKRTANGLGVVGTDIHLERLSQQLITSLPTSGSVFALLNHDSLLVSSQEKSTGFVPVKHAEQTLPRLEDLHSEVLTMVNQSEVERVPFTFTTKEGESWEGVKVNIIFAENHSLTLLMASPHSELLADVNKSSFNTIMVSISMVLTILLLIPFISRLLIWPLRTLQDEMRKIEQFDFDDPVCCDSPILEIRQLASALGNLKQNIHGLLELTRSLASEPHFDAMLSQIIINVTEQTGVDGGVLFVQQQEGLILARANWYGERIDLGPNPVTLPTSHPLHQALGEQQQFLQLSGEASAHAFPYLPVSKHSVNLCILPLDNMEHDRLGVLVLLLDNKSAITPQWHAFAKALANSAAIALNIQHLLNEHKQLLEAFIKLIAGAIDAKSPYTGNHCQRVPELAKMLAQAACVQTNGTFADFQLSDEDWEALHIAGWLHDCGKVTTPEFVVDKATKLETIYNRLHEIRMRFEVLKRDAEIACWRGIAEGGDKTSLEADRDHLCAILDEEFAFVATCNEGSEFMGAEQVERLRSIGERTWLRTLPDHIGLSREELARKSLVDQPSLPVQETLLADKQDHIVPRTGKDIISADNSWGIRMKVPEHLYNRGELYNLSISRGTLCEEERFKINEHIIQTIIMLDKLPFPRHLHKVPEIACSHHERWDGKGYPRGLSREQMSIPARIMAIADVFEALTAVDRPYKKGKLLSESLDIMAQMSCSGHLDPELFELFLREGVYRDYALRFMSPAQIDEVDISRYLTPGQCAT